MIRRLVEAVARGLTRNVAFTSPEAEDPRLRGRTYAVPFEDVWQSTLKLMRGGLRRWSVTEADDQEGIIRGAAHGLIERYASSITVRITLDENAQTRVDALAASTVAKADLGLNARRLRRFFDRLDRHLEERRGTGIDRLRIDRETSTAGS